MHMVLFWSSLALWALWAVAVFRVVVTYRRLNARHAELIALEDRIVGRMEIAEAARAAGAEEDDA